MGSHYTKAVYRFWAKIYDRFVDPLFRFDRQKVVDALKIRPDEKILEIGVGTGLNLPYYPKNCKVQGIDLSKEMLAKAMPKKTDAKVYLSRQDATKLDFKDNTFDKALTTYVLRVLPDPKKILTEASRVVKKEGIFVIVDQFKGKHRILLALAQPFKMMLGWGKEYDILDLIKDTDWTVISNTRFGRMSNTRLVILSNTLKKKTKTLKKKLG